MTASYFAVALIAGCGNVKNGASGGNGPVQDASTSDQDASAQEAEAAAGLDAGLDAGDAESAPGDATLDSPALDATAVRRPRRRTTAT